MSFFQAIMPSDMIRSTALGSHICSSGRCIKNAVEGQKYCPRCRETFLRRELKRYPFRQDGWVYFVRESSSGCIKIGTALDPERRLAGMQTNCPTDLELLAATHGGAFEEKAFHEYFAEHRVRGEWFNPCPEMLELIAGYREVEKHNAKKRLLLACRELGIHRSEPDTDE